MRGVPHSRDDPHELLSFPDRPDPPLRPTRQEIEEAVYRSRASGSALARELDVERLILEIPGSPEP
jgi:hypothetical protein